MKIAVLEHMKYLATRIFKGHALLVRLSDFKGDKETVLSLLDESEQMGSCTRFTLANTDEVLFFNNNKAHHMMLLAVKIKNSTRQNICESYNLKSDYATLYHKLAAPYTLSADTLAEMDAMQHIPHKPFDEEQLKQALTSLQNMSLVHLIRRQPIFTATGEKTGLVSCFVPLSDVRKALLPNTDIADNLFFYALLRSAVQENILRKILPTQKEGVVNVDLDVFKSPHFQEWLSAQTPEQKSRTAFSISFAQMIQNMGGYLQLCDILRAQGYRFIVRLNHIPKHLKWQGIPADFIQIPVGLVSDLNSDDIPLDKIILSGITTQSEYEQALNSKCAYLQGTFVSQLLHKSVN